MLRRLKENKKKGFALVELIVVLVILAILAALLVPALTGYIDKAKRKSIVAETRQVVMAAQTIADEEYGKGAVGATITFDNAEDSTKAASFVNVKKLAEVKGTIKTITVGTTDKAGIVTVVVYENSGKTCTYTKDATDGTDGAYNVN